MATQNLLSPNLYALLKKRYRDVLVSKQGCVRREYVAGYDHSNKPKYKTLEAGEQYRISCPYCGDTRKRLYVNYMFGQPGPDGFAMHHLVHCFNEDCLSKYENRIDFADKLFGFQNKNVRSNIATALPINEPLWQDVVPAFVQAAGDVIPAVKLAESQPKHPAVEYLLSRGYTYESCCKYDVGFCIGSIAFPAAVNRIIYPIYMRHTLVGWQARYVGDPPKGCSKYYNMPGIRKQSIMYNIDRAKEHPFVCIAEGVTVVHNIGDNVVAILGKDFSQFHMEVVVRHWAGKPVIVLLDEEAKIKANAMVADLVAAGCKAIAVFFPDKHDGASLPRDVVLANIYKAASDSGIYLPEFATPW